MKNYFLSTDSKLKYCLQWIIIYIIVVAIGITSTLVATYLNNTHMQDIASYDYKQYIETGSFNPNVAINGAHNVVYDKNKNAVALYPESDSSDFSPEQLDKILTKLEGKDSDYSLRFDLKAEHKIAITVAYPLDDGGLFIFYREPPFVRKTIIIISTMIGILVVMMATYMYMVIAMSQKNRKMQRDYVDNITHELKSPISSVKALTETMYDGLIQDEEKRKRYYKIILNEMSGLENTVSSMLELSKIQNKQIDCSKSQLSSYEVFGSTIEKYAALCDERKMQFSVTPDIDNHVTLYTNKALASRILDILLDNATKFASQENGAININFKDDSNVMTITGSNNGATISTDDQKLIFSRFYKGDKSHNEKGSGLGLSIAQEIVLSLGEKLWLQSSGPEGTAFSFTIRKY